MKTGEAPGFRLKAGGSYLVPNTLLPAPFPPTCQTEIIETIMGNLMKRVLLMAGCAALVLSGLVGCSRSDEGSGGALAPENPYMKEFRFYPEIDRWSLRMMPGAIPEAGVVVVNSSTALVQNPHVYYTRTGSNTAYLSCNFQAMVALGGSTYGTFYEYEYNLTFTSAHQGVYWGRAIVNYTEEEIIEGYFMYDSADDPTPEQGDNPGGDPGEGEPDPDDPGGEAPEDTPERLFVKISTVSPSRIYFHVEYQNPGEYTNPDDYLKAGICYGTQPGPTVLDQTTSIEVVRPNSDSYSGTDILASNTTYYLRPYRKVNGETIYYEETSVRTPGETEASDLMLRLTYVSENQVRCEYRINTDGTYKMELRTWDLQGTYAVHDFGTRSEGDRENYLHAWSLPWGSTRYFFLRAIDAETGIWYESDHLYKP